MSIEAEAKPQSWLQKFTAVDLITIAIFAVLLRFGFFYVYRALSVAFPFSQAVFPVFLAFCLTGVLALVPKGGAATLFTVAWQLINLFFQGEDVRFLLMYIPVPIVTELAFVMMKKYGDDMRSAIIGSMVYIALATVAVYFAIVYIFLMTEYTIPIALGILALSTLVSAPVGGYIGHKVGVQLKKLLP